ncbi:SMI1/KNR4 family protein [Laceyella sacchari]|uniref:SMI1/KNR4 family protein n=1 Tax=Laceyella sacchari TaxID=37482 RepID=A0ABY5U763_LACSH|nr:SMI1/KNR4 family protein [Laceyella sacchari]UWE04870.1 SMI1/KNR4 family protein [Laceyella sacchari]
MTKWEAVKQLATDEDIQRIEEFVGQRLPRACLVNPS